MAYVALYLKYRPQRFLDLVGQEHVARTLTNAVNMERVAHAYLFSGPRGTGKTSAARILAKALNCAHGRTAEPCGECSHCLAIARGAHLDVIEVDAASNRGIDEVRDLREKARYLPGEARAKVYIVDEVHMLTPEAFNALLKTLEEPPPHVFFILATTDASRVPHTIVSRCQRFEFRRVGQETIRNHLLAIAEKEGLELDPPAAQLLAVAADGSVRDAISVMDQAATYSAGTITTTSVIAVMGLTQEEALAQAVRLVVEADLRGTLALVEELTASGKDLPRFLRDLAQYLRDAMVSGLKGRPVRYFLDDADHIPPALHNLGETQFLAALEVLCQAEEEMRRSPYHRLILELALIRMSRVLGGGAVAPPGPVAVPEPAGPSQPSPSLREPNQEPPGSPPPVAPSSPPEWKAVLDELEEQRCTPVLQLVQEAEAHIEDEDALVLTFDFAFNREQFDLCLGSRLGGAEAFHNAVERAFGRPLQVRTRLPAAASQSGVVTAQRETTGTLDFVRSLFPEAKRVR